MLYLSVGSGVMGLLIGGKVELQSNLALKFIAPPKHSLITGVRRNEIGEKSRSKSITGKERVASSCTYRSQQDQRTRRR